jgi:ribosomal protein L37AE/L43A
MKDKICCPACGRGKNERQVRDMIKRSEWRCGPCGRYYAITVKEDILTLSYREKHSSASISALLDIDETLIDMDKRVTRRGI